MANKTKSLSSSKISLFLFIFLLPVIIYAVPTNNLSLAHTELTKHNFPVGLLPTNVNSYVINATSGDFAVRLRHNCRITLPPDNYLASYSKKITGKIVDNRIADIKGIDVWAFFKWWGITGIRSDGLDLVFEVGVLSAKYPANNFHVAPTCEGKHSSSS